MRKKHKKRRPTRDELRQYVFDYGYYRACRMFGLAIQDDGTSRIAENILYGAKPSTPKDKSPADEVILQIDPKAAPILDAINDYYDELKKHVVRDDGNTIDPYQGLTSEDRFHEMLLVVLQTLDRFEFESEESTVNYIFERLTWQHKAIRKTLQRLREKIYFADITNIPEESQEFDVAAYIDEVANKAKFDVKLIIDKRKTA